MTWRPWEPSREAVRAAQEAQRENTCNRHDDCEAETLRWMARNKAKRWELPADFHCHSDDCEECFGS